MFKTNDTRTRVSRGERTSRVEHWSYDPGRYEIYACPGACATSGVNSPILVLVLVHMHLQTALLAFSTDIYVTRSLDVLPSFVQYTSSAGYLHFATQRPAMCPTTLVWDIEAPEVEPCWGQQHVVMGEISAALSTRCGGSHRTKRNVADVVIKRRGMLLRRARAGVSGEHGLAECQFSTWSRRRTENPRRLPYD